MRPGPKLAAYRLLSRVLAGLGGRAWRLLVVGGGSARPEVEAALGVLPPDRIRFLGEQSPEGVSRILAAADLCVWAAAREPVGLSLLEAQAAGIPVVACRTPGVATVVEDGATGILAGCSGPADLRRALVALLDDPARRERLGRAARRRVLRDHGLDAAAERLREVLATAATVARGGAR
jgi:glycosyltransferase involved in cell wall biosynthesis